MSKIIYYAINAAAITALAVVLAIFATIIFIGWELPRYFRKLELRHVYKGDQTARAKAEFRE